MKRIGDVLTTLSIPVGPAHRNGSATTKPSWRCAKCKDAGWVRMEVPVGHPNFGRLFPCECKVAEQAERGRDKLRRLSNLEAFTQHSFDDFEVVAGTEQAFAAAREFARNPDGWLYLYGGVGTGKTHLAVAAALEIRERNGSVYFAVVPDLLDHLRTTFDPAQGVAYDDRFNAIRGAFLLVLDDLGTENTTPWARRSCTRSSTTATSSGCRRSSPPTGNTRTSTSASAPASSTCGTRKKSNSARRISACAVTPTTCVVAGRDRPEVTSRGLRNPGRETE